MALFRLCPVRKKRVLFMSYYGKHTNCNPWAIYEYIKNADLPYECIWVDNSGKLEGKTVKYASIAFYYYVRTSQFLIFNARPNFDIKKRRDQKYIQTWHSSLGFKMIERDAEDTLDKRYVQKAKKDSTYIDILISGCRFRTECFNRNFWYSGEIAQIGTPRNDVLFAQNRNTAAAAVKDELGVSTDTRILLYAPTFRNSGDISYATSLDAEGLALALSERFGGEWRIVYRLHPNVNAEGLLPPAAIDASTYKDMQALLIASDALITDYSSVMFDFMLLDRPCFIYAPDYSEYVKKERNTYFKIDELPFEVCTDNASLTAAVRDFDSALYCDSLQQFKDRIGSFECGTASQKIIEWMNNQ
jgi:CDP-glycerol glycerophosphotransferase